MRERPPKTKSERGRNRLTVDHRRTDGSRHVDALLRTPSNVREADRCHAFCAPRRFLDSCVRHSDTETESKEAMLPTE